MNESEFLGEIDAIVQVPAGTTRWDDQLASLKGWDSMAIIMFISMVDEKCGVAVDISMLASCQTVGDMAALCDGKIACAM